MQALIIPDLHLPYQHPATFDFLADLRRTYKPQKVVQIGDMYDLHHQSFHDKHPELLGPRAEYEAAKRGGKVLEKIFPDLISTRGNHDRRPARVGQKFGLLPEMLASENSLWDVDFQFCSEYWLKLDDGTRVLCRHGDGGFPKFGSPSRRYTHHTVTGHHHTLGGVHHYTLMDGTRRWMAATGALIDETSPAFAYTPHKAVLGALVIHEDDPIYEPLRT